MISRVLLPGYLRWCVCVVSDMRWFHRLSVEATESEILSHTPIHVCPL
jgi:hypothetical protein